MGVLSQPVVEHDDAQRVQQLPFVFVNALDLAIEDVVRIDCLTRGRFEPVGELALWPRAWRRGTHCGKLLSPARGSSLLQLPEIGHPAVADGLGDRAGERRVRQQQPAPRRDAVGLVVETARETSRPSP